MKTYKLRVLYPSSNSSPFHRKQFEEYSVIASSIDIDKGSYLFYDNYELIACYPVQYTIITSIK